MLQGMFLSLNQVYVMYHGGFDLLVVIQCHEIPDGAISYSANTH